MAAVLTHTLDPEVLQRYGDIREDLPDCRVLLVVDRDAVSRSRLEQARRNLGDRLVPFRRARLAGLPYPGKTSGSDFRVVPGNCDLIWLWLAMERPGHDRYWFIEYDVEFTGSWEEVVGHFASSGADLLGTTLHRRRHEPDWEHWEGLNSPTGVPESRYLRGFFPVIRLSREALATLDEAYRRGWSGHTEAVVPTVLDFHGLDIEDLGGDGPFVRPHNRNRFYTRRVLNDKWLPPTFVHRPARGTPGLRRRKLWHPVKPGQGRLLPHVEIVLGEVGDRVEALARSLAQALPVYPGRSSSPGKRDCSSSR